MRLWNLAVVLKGRQAGSFFPKIQPLPSPTRSRSVSTLGVCRLLEPHGCTCTYVLLCIAYLHRVFLFCKMLPWQLSLLLSEWVNCAKITPPFDRWGN